MIFEHRARETSRLDDAPEPGAFSIRCLSFAARCMRAYTMTSKSLNVCLQFDYEQLSLNRNSSHLVHFSAGNMPWPRAGQTSAVLMVRRGGTKNPCKQALLAHTVYRAHNRLRTGGACSSKR